jgi:two-component system chemotaxis sensor kinase CheA
VLSDENDEIITEFLVESHENLDRLDQALVDLERQSSPEQLADIFRTIHTIKGTAGFLGFGQLESTTHAGENLLSRVRDGRLAVNADITSALLSLIDLIRQLLAQVEETGAEGVVDAAGVVAELERVQEPPAERPVPAAEPVAVGPEPVALDPEPVVVEPEPVAVTPEPVIEPEPVAVAPVPEPVIEPEPAAEVFPESEREDPARFGDLLIDSGKVTPDAVAEAVRQQQDGDPRHLGELLVEAGHLAPAEVAETLRTQGDGRQKAADSTIRVDVSLLDKLMNLVGELVLARNQILQFTSTQSDGGFISTSQRLNLITTELQEGVMKTRMQPIGNLWAKFPRVVRDLAVACGKQVRIEMEGTETELDKTILEAIKDPLTHLVRNSVDHGMEDPDRRVETGKPAEGRLVLRAFHEGGKVNIEIIDDGAGIDLAAVKRRAVERGLVSAEMAHEMSDREASNLIFLPGFSTATKITNVSGRGVGMDVVKTNIEKIGGTVDVQSRAGHGTTVRIKIPLTLAIIPALVVTSGGDRYAIPQVSLLELVRLEGEQARAGVELIHNKPVYRLRGQILPLVSLAAELGMAPPLKGGEDLGEVNIVVLQADDRQFGLVVDSVNDTEEIVVKPLSKQLKGVSVFAGATIMGDGAVALILDVLGIAQRSGVVNEVRDRALADAEAVHAAHGDEQTLLVVAAGANGRMAIPLAEVDRLEEFPPSVVEWAAAGEVVQYRSRILPLVRLSNELGLEPAPVEETTEGAEGLLQVVVHTQGDRSVGLVVDRILDIVDEAIVLDRHGMRTGIVGSAIVQERVTGVLDVGALVEAVMERLSVGTRS